MKEVFVIVKITLIGLFVTVVFYPLVHESGHLLFALITGGKFISLSWFPAPNVLCEMNADNTTSLAITSLAGMMFPILFLLPFYKSKSNLRFGALLMSGITVLSMLIGVSVAVLRFASTIIPNDDVTAFINFTGWVMPTILIMFSLTIITILQFILLKPKQTLMTILNVKTPSKYVDKQFSRTASIENI